jgi:hypothetical protein
MELLAAGAQTLIIGGAAIEGIAEDRAADTLEMDSDLVGAAGVQGCGDGTKALAGIEGLAIGTDFFATGGEESHLMPLARMASDGAVETAAAGIAEAEGEVALMYLTGSKGSDESTLSHVRLSSDEETRCIFIQTMDDTWT